MKRYSLGALGAGCLLLAGLQAVAQPDLTSFTLFETGQVRPVAISPNGNLLLVANTPYSRLEIFSIDTPIGDPRIALTQVASVPVGREPIAVAPRSQTEVWVLNHLSDSVSIVDISTLSRARVVRSLYVGDEPRDIVFGGPARDRAFITTAHRGQNARRCTAPFNCQPLDPQLTTPGIGRADVWVFDANNLGEGLGGTPLTVITLFSDTPRALAVTPDGRTVYAAAFLSGNRTTTIPAGSVVSQGLPPPTDNFLHAQAPLVGLIVKFRRSPVDGLMHWLDEMDRSWDSRVRLSLPDRDVFVIDAAANPPAQRPDPLGFFTSVGTVLFNMAVNPVSGRVYVSNTDAQNHIRFEGPGIYAATRQAPNITHTVRGHLAESRITVLDGSNVVSRHLNKHIDYNRAPEPTPNPTSRRSLATPTSLAVSNDGSTLYVAAFGSSKVGIFNTTMLENNTFAPRDPPTNCAADYAAAGTCHTVVSGGGPSGLVLDESRRALYVLTRFDNSISIIDTTTRAEINHVSMFNPEPPSITVGRRFLYDANATSSNGEASCSSCHIFGDFDGLAWDLGNPDGTTLNNPGPFRATQSLAFHPMKGPMTTQSLRGMDNMGPMHWRGDRTGGNDAPSFQPDSGSFDEQAAFMKFIAAFEGLLGRSAPISDADMHAFTNFAIQIMYPPNPIKSLDNILNADQLAGQDFFFSLSSGGLVSDGSFTCNGCHTVDPMGNAQYGVARPGFFGGDGFSSGAGESQLFKVPHLRNQYQKVGMFGSPPDPLFIDANPFMGDQVRGFGFLHDGSVDTVFRFMSHAGFVFDPTFNPGGLSTGPDGAAVRRQAEAFQLAFYTDLKPMVGQQVTLTSTNPGSVGPRIDLMETRATAGDCDLVAKGLVQGQPAGFLYNGDGTFSRSPTADLISDLALRALAQQPGGELTFTCIRPGFGGPNADEL